MNANPNPSTEPETPQTAPDFAALVRRAEAGDSTVLPELRKLLDERSEIWQTYGDLAVQAEAALVKLAAGSNLLLAESLMRKLADLRAELGTAESSPLDRLLVARSVMCWLQVAYWDGVLGQGKSLDNANLETLRRQQDSANRRYLTSLRTLATVRKLLRPVVSPVQIATTLQGKRASGFGGRKQGSARTAVLAAN